MGGAHGKSLHTSSTNIQSYDINDPRSPSLKRTPLNTPEPADWRQKAMRTRMAAKEDPRSPTTGIDRTPVSEGQVHFDEPVTPLTLSYGDRKINPDDPRSPMTCRTPLNHTQGIPKYDVNVAACAPFNDDTVIVSEQEVVETSELDETILISSSALIYNPLAGMTIVTSTETTIVSQPQESVETVKEEEERKESTPEVERRELVQSEQDIEVPSSPLGASACKLEDSQERDKEKRLSSPGLPSDRKRKKANQLLGVSPLKKSFSSPSIVDQNDENSVNAPAFLL
eukprot:Phypoly_transcript_14765.p1 GENE.Phypoly_transcript_14765~~Phypoly_transcript_14765.p1  ORF type:complete len:317 (+),score=66.41 Phypoly_transcript_14765:101-952(+)